MTESIALFLTWTTYGSWLPGDARGSTSRGGRPVSPDESLQRRAERAMTESPCLLTVEQRTAVEQVIRRHCELRNWTLHAVNVRTNHVHVVVFSGDAAPKRVREELKSWSTRTLRAADESGRVKWWTAGGDITYLYDEAAVAEKVDYVLNGQ
ncbi:transposase [Alienimonas chondri]|uniref:Transposase IS200-like domain-containing protein n=1 Tax=Alienimonas chondri TaxID=2681879 RepID=A0ABX1VIK2_9PLAN|nr:transposase [Alienimonas chondri]NNJ27723.1 hypothetical protein [Alienimonas chondri]